MIYDSSELETIYSQRFAGRREYRDRVWRVLIQHFFQRFVGASDAVLDLGCGYGEFINNIACGAKYGMDLNPTTGRILMPEIRFLQQDCSKTWPLPDDSLDVVFTSNFFEHLPEKRALAATLAQAHRCLKPGGRLIALGPNIKFLPGAHWDFWDHHLPLTELSLSEGMRNLGFTIDLCYPRFLPYTMVRSPEHPLFLIRAYLAMPWAWRFFGKQFLVIGLCKKEEKGRSLVSNP